MGKQSPRAQLWVDSYQRLKPERRPDHRSERGESLLRLMSLTASEVDLKSGIERAQRRIKAKTEVTWCFHLGALTQPQGRCRMTASSLLAETGIQSFRVRKNCPDSSSGRDLRLRGLLSKRQMWFIQESHEEFSTFPFVNDLITAQKWAWISGVEGC